MLALVIDCLKNAGLEEFQISIGNVDFFQSLIEESEIDDETEERLRELINNRNFFGADELLEEMCIRDRICTSCEVNKGKPAPDVYLKAAGQLGAEPSACLVFEDVPMGILAGKNAGMRVCAVDDWFSRPQDAKKRELADYFIHSYEDITNQTYEVL